MRAKLVKIVATTGKIPHLSALLGTGFRSYIATSHDNDFHDTASSDLEDLIRSRCQSGNLDLDEAMGYFNSLIEIQPLASVWSFNHLFGSLYRMGHYSLVVSMYKVLTGFEDYRPEVTTLNSVMRCYCRLRRLDLAFSVLAAVFKQGLEPNAHTLTILLHQLCSEGLMVAAMRLFEEMVEKEYPGYEFAYAIVINGLCKAGETWRAFELLKHSYHSQRIKPNESVFNPVIGGFCRQGQVDQAFGLFDVMINLSVSPSVITCNSLIQGLCKCGRWEEVDRFLVDIQLKHGISPDVRTYNILIDSLCKGERTVEAMSLLKLMTSTGVDPDVFTFNCLLSGLCKCGQWNKVSELLEIMNGFGISPDNSTFATMVDALAKEGRISEAINLVEEMTSRGVKPNVIVYNSLIYGFCCLGQWREGMKLLERMDEQGIQPCVFTFTILADALCKQGRTKEALKLLRDMIEKGVRPDNRARKVLRRTLAKSPKHVDCNSP